MGLFRLTTITVHTRLQDGWLADIPEGEQMSRGDTKAVVVCSANGAVALAEHLAGSE